MTSDEPPSRLQQVDTSPFFLDGSGLSVLLIHGLTGTPYEMRYLGERLAAAGFRVKGVCLAGHGGPPEALGGTTHDNWYESVISGLEELHGYGDPIVVVGISCGAVLAARLAEDQREAVAAIVMLSPAFFIPWKLTAGLRALELLGPLTRRVYLHNDVGSDIHDQSARLIHPSAKLMPLSAPIELLKLSSMVRKKLGRVIQPALIVHSTGDHTCPCEKNVAYLMEHLGSAEKRAVILEESFHVITVDSEKDRVASEVIGFASQFRAPAARRCALG